MNVLVVEPGFLPYEKEINGLAEMQKLSVDLFRQFTHSRRKLPLYVMRTAYLRA